jgi:hypothetical protein
MLNDDVDYNFLQYNTNNTNNIFTKSNVITINEKKKKNTNKKTHNTKNNTKKNKNNNKTESTEKTLVEIIELE